MRINAAMAAQAQARVEDRFADPGDRRMIASAPWPSLLQLFGGAGVGYQLPPLILAALLLLRAGPARREGLSGSLLLYGAGLGGLLLAAGLHWLGQAAAAGFAREAAVTLLGIACIRLGGITLFRVLLPAAGMTPPRILEDILTFAGYLLWAMLRLSQLGLNFGGIVTTSAVITGILAFSLQDTLGNILGGTTLQLESSIRVGDWIKVDDVIGRITDIRWRSTLLETRNGETVVLPNALLMKTRFTILGRRSGAPLQWRRWVWFSVEQSVSPQRVVGIVETALRKSQIANVAAEPAPGCVVMDIGETAVRYALRYWLTDLWVDDPTDSAVRQHVHTALLREGIRLWVPEQTLYLVREGDERNALLRRQDLERKRNVLRDIELFRDLDAAELDLLAPHLVFAPFLAGETITRQGDMAHWLYLLVSGEVAVSYVSDDGRKRSLGPISGGAGGAFFGEMGMLTGAARSATVVAASDVLCYRLDKLGFEQVLKARPALAEQISAVVARRRAELASTRDALAQEARERQLAHTHHELLGRIRHFFGLEQAAAAVPAAAPAALPAAPAPAALRVPN